VTETEQKTQQTLKYPVMLLEKGLRLVREAQVSRVNATWFKVHDRAAAPTFPFGFNVQKSESDVWNCDCPGFRKRRIRFCSHILAVMVIESREKARCKKT